jgi:membrane-bound ClpP family serine protease
MDGSQAREMNFVNYLAADRTSLARALKLQPEAVQDDPALAGGWKPVQVNIKGAVTSTNVDITRKKIDEQIDQNGVNLIVLWIDSDGCSFDSSIQLANHLVELDSTKIRTVAYIPHHARGDAALLALACDQIVMAPDAVLGGTGMDILDAGKAASITQTLREMAKRNDKSRSWSLPAAMIDEQLKVYQYKQPSTGLIGYFCEQELSDQADPASWRQGELVTKPNGPLRLSGREAEAKGVAWKLADNFEQFKQAYGLQHSPSLVEPGWADFLIQALATPEARIFLLVLGFAGLYLEINTPGIGLGSFIAIIAFLLYFWAQYLQGTANAMEIMLFLGGVVCLAIEILVLPGFGVFGLGGGLMVIASLVLASQTFVIPGNDYQLAQMRNSLLVLGGTAMGVIAASVTLRRFLPHTPGLNRMLLAPPSGEELEALSQREALADFRHLQGREGVATTRLVLSGKARFGDELVDVLADGEPIDRGARVRVIEVTGSRVMVREVRDE